VWPLSKKAGLLRAGGGKVVITWSTKSKPSNVNDPRAYEKAVSFTIPSARSITAIRSKPSQGKKCSDRAFFVPVAVKCVYGKCNMPATMYTGTSFNPIAYGYSYGLVSNMPQNQPQCDWGPDYQRFRALYYGSGPWAYARDDFDAVSSGSHLKAIAIWAGVL
jgi:hypothetical protein